MKILLREKSCISSPAYAFIHRLDVRIYKYFKGIPEATAPGAKVENRLRTTRKYWKKGRNAFVAPSTTSRPGRIAQGVIIAV